MKTTEANKLIAEFMGYRECPRKLFRMDDEFQFVKIYSEYQEEDEYLTIEAGKRQIKFTPDEMQFHTSWDWLMPVVEKIEEIALEEVEGSYKVHRFNVKIESFYCIITDGKDEHRELIVADDGDKKSNVYYAVVEFIKWYNENK